MKHREVIEEVADEFLLDLPSADKQKKETSLNYLINGNPDFNFEVN